MAHFPYYMLTHAYLIGTPEWRILDSGVVAMRMGNGVLRVRDEFGQAVYAIDLKFAGLSAADAAILFAFKATHKRGVSLFYWQDVLVGPESTSDHDTFL